MTLARLAVAALVFGGLAGACGPGADPVSDPGLGVGQASGQASDPSASQESGGGDAASASLQQTCPPCRQPLSLYDGDVWVTRGTARVDVCCPGCAAKMVGDWDGYLEILGGLGERPAQVEEVGGAPVVSNDQQRPVCLPCSGGLCMLPEHLPPASDG